MARPRATASSPGLIHLGSLRFFSQVFGGAALGMIVADLRGRITHANPAAEALLGWEPGELVGRSVTELADPGRAPVLFEQVAAAGGTWTGEILERRKSGAVLPIRLTVGLVCDDDDERVGTVAVLADDRESQRWLARLESLVRLGAALNADLDLGVLLSRLCREARDLFAVDTVFLGKLDEARQELVGLVAEGQAVAGFVGQRMPQAPFDTTPTIAVRDRRPVIRRAGASDGQHEELIDRHGVKSALAAPLLRGESVLGMLLLVDSHRDDRFGDEDVELVQVFAEVAAVALEYARLHAAEQAKNDRLLTLARIGRLLTASLERQEVFRAIVDGAQRLLRVDEVRIWLLEAPDGPLRLAHARTLGAVTIEALDFRGSRIDKVIRAGRPWQTDNISADDRWREKEYIQEHGLHSCLTVSLIAQGRPLGGLTILTCAVRTFDAEEIGLAQAFADQAAIAVRNAETLARERRAGQLERLLDDATALSTADRGIVEVLLSTAERLVELGEQTVADRSQRDPDH